MSEPKIAMSEVKSSLVHSHGYDPGTQKMRVRFVKNGQPGDTWEYDDVPPEKYAAFTGAASHGSFFQKRIKAAHNGRKVAS